MSRPKTVVLGVTASVAIYKACEILRRLQDAGLCVKVVMTKEAESLISPHLFRGLCKERVYRGDVFGGTESREIEHVSLAESANLVLVAPATANLIAKIAGGICDDLLTCIICATAAPVLIAPAMNEGMYRNKITQANIAKLKSSGYKFVGPRQGRLACGSKGMGCLAETEDILKAVKEILG